MYLEDFIRESNSSLIEELNVCSLEDLLISEKVAEEKDEGIAIKNIGLLMFTTMKIHEGFEFENRDFGQKNDRSLTEVLTKKNYDKLLPIIKYLDKNKEITPQTAEMRKYFGKI